MAVSSDLSRESGGCAVHLGVRRSRLGSLAGAQMSIPVPARAAALPQAASARPLCKPPSSKVDKCKIQRCAPNCLLVVNPVPLKAQEASAGVPVSLAGGA